MRTTIDSGGRVVIPKVLRERFGLRPGQEVEVDGAGSAITVTPVSPTTRVEVRDGVFVAVTEGGEGPALDATAERELLEALRERRA